MAASVLWLSGDQKFHDLWRKSIQKKKAGKQEKALIHVSFYPQGTDALCLFRKKTLLFFLYQNTFQVHINFGTINKFNKYKS